jgi:hypothetical protein
VRGPALVVLLVAACDYQPRPSSQGARRAEAAAAPAAAAAGERRLDSGDCALTLAVDGMT